MIAKPKRGVSTKAVFEKIDSSPIAVHPDTAGMLECIKNKDIRGISEKICNVFEPVVQVEVEEILEIKKTLLENGALSAKMTGSGSAVFGIFTDEAAASVAKGKLLQRFDEAFCVKPVNLEAVRNPVQCF